MRKFALLCASLAATLVALLPAAPARALNLKSFVSSAGSGSACTRAAPCGDFNAAHLATMPGGEINCLDSGPFGGAFITKSITIDCAGTAAVTDEFTVDGAGIVVKIRNLSFSGSLVGTTRGIKFLDAAALFVENCIIKDVALVESLGISFQPTAPGSQLIVTDTVIGNNGNHGQGAGGGIQIAPQAGGSAGVVLNRVRLGFNETAMVLNSANGPIGAVMTDSVVTSSQSNGILSIAGQSINFTIKHSKLVNNVGVAVQSQGANSTVRISDSTIADNQTGVSAVSGGVVQSYKDNRIGGNGSDGTPLAAFPGPGGTLLQ